MEKIEQLKEKIIDLKKKELEYVEIIVKTGNDRILTDEEKLDIYRSLEKYKDMFNEATKNFNDNTFRVYSRCSVNINIIKEILEQEQYRIEFNVNPNYLDCIKENVNWKLVNFYKKCGWSDLIYKGLHERKLGLYDALGIDYHYLKFKIKWWDYISREYSGVDINQLLEAINQKFIDKPIFIFDGYVEEGLEVPLDYPVYYDIFDKMSNSLIIRDDQRKFEENKTIIERGEVSVSRIIRTFNKEIHNYDNKTIADCLQSTIRKINDSVMVRKRVIK